MYQQSNNTIFKLLAKKSQKFGSYQQEFFQNSFQQSPSSFNNNQLPQQQQYLSTKQSLSNNNNQFKNQQRYNIIEEEVKFNGSNFIKEESKETKINDEVTQAYKRINFFKSNSEENDNKQDLNEINIKRKISLITNYDQDESNYLSSKIIKNHIMRQRKVSDITDEFLSCEPQVTKKQQYSHFKPIITSQVRYRHSIDAGFNQSMLNQNLNENSNQSNNLEANNNNNNDDSTTHINGENHKSDNCCDNQRRVNQNQEYIFIPKSCPLKPKDEPFNSNCFYSPLQTSKNLHQNYNYQGKTTGQMLDDDDFSLTNNSYNNSSNSEDDDMQIEIDFELKRLVDNILLVNQAKYHKNSKISRISSKVSLICYFNHRFELSVQQLKDNQWCGRCQAQLSKIKNYAKSNNGNCLNQVYTPNLIYQCQKNHIWDIPHKVWNKKWCIQCDKQQKEELKKQFKEREEKIQQERMKLQEELFNEAKRNMQYNNNQQKQFKQQQTLTFQQKVINAFLKIEQEILKVAQEKSNEYIQQKIKLQQENTIQVEQIVSVFKMILLPDNILKQYFEVLTHENLKQEYRKMALSIHPDKNKHPKASLAFQKLNNIHSEIAERQNQRNQQKNY